GLRRKEITDAVGHDDEVVQVHVQLSVRGPKRSGSAYSTSSSRRAKPASARPARRAVSTARAVGADTATRAVMPAATALRTISTLARLVMQQKPARGSMPASTIAP